MPDFQVLSAGGAYNVEFHDSIQGVYDAVEAIPNARVISDIFVKRMFGKDNHYGLASLEACKTLRHVEDLCDWLNAEKVGKDGVLVAIGGGVIQDVATMAASIYKRGIKLVLVPTTLMAQADSCIGAKCGINIGAMKNQVGCFYSPTRVLVCHQFLNTLPGDHIASGYGEILKLLLIGNHFQLARDWVDCGGIRNNGLPEIIYRSLRVKQQIIEADEKETGKLRVLLNYGHTFGHALEANMRVPHGLAVAWGIDVANYINCKHLRLLSEDTYFMVKDFIAKHLPRTIDSKVAADDLMVAIRHDKKVKSNETIDIVVMDRPGEMHLSSVSLADLSKMIEGYLATEDVYV